MRRRLWIFCAIAGVLTAIAFVPGILVIAAFLGGLPAIILILAPYALLVGLTILVVRIRSPRRQSLNKTAIAWVLAGCVLSLAVAAAWFNHRLEQEVQALTKEDRDLSEPMTGTRDIAIQFVTIERARLKSELARQQELTNSDVVPPPTRKQFCERLCLHLLFDGQADSVLVSSVSVNEGDPAPPDLAEIGMRFHLGRSACRNPAVKTEDFTPPPYRLFDRGAEEGFAEQVSARMIAGQCVIGEAARLSEAQIIVQENPWVLLHGESNYPLAKNVLHLNLPPKGAARLSIYRVRDGSLEEVFRQTQVDAYPLLPVLLVGPVFTGEGGIGISEGFLRRHHAYSQYNLHDVLQSKLGFNIAPISR